MIRRRLMQGGEEGMQKWTTDGIADGSEPYGDIVITGNVRGYAFYGNTGITSVVANNMNTFNAYLFYNCKALKAASVNTRATMNGGTGCFMGCASLEKADIGDKIKYLPVLFFKTCIKLSVIILRYNGVVALGNETVFGETPFGSGGTGGTIYVPESLIESYKTANFWSTLYEAGTVTFAAIEGSEYKQ